MIARPLHFWHFGGCIIANGWGVVPHYVVERPALFKGMLERRNDPANAEALADLTAAMEEACRWLRAAA